MLKKIHKSINKLKEENELINSQMQAYYDESADDNYLDFFTRLINKLLHGEKSTIFINEDGEDNVWFEIGAGADKQVSSHKEGSMVDRVIESGIAEINNNLDPQKAISEVYSENGSIVYNAICVPIKTLDGERVSGVIQIVNKENKEPFNENDQKWLEEISRNIQVNIEHISLHRGSLSITDKIFELSGKLIMIATVLFLTLIAGLTLYLLVHWLVS